MITTCSPVYQEIKNLKAVMALYLVGKCSQREFSEAADRFERAVQAARGGASIDLGKKP